MKRIGLSFISVIVITCSFGQTLFTYGSTAVTRDEFIKAFNKNPNITGDRKKALKEYLDLYVNFKLKVQAAYDAGLDKDATQQYELQNFRNQAADNVINEEANVKALAKEAFLRSRKEIHLSQIFIEVPGNADTAEAYKDIHTAYRQLQQGKDFGELNQQYSTDEPAKQAKGDLGYITAFSLPYDLESIVYNLKINSFSAPIKSKAGYHIFKNTGERKASGTRKVAQILIAVPPNASVADKNAASKKADSIYTLLLKNANFDDLAAKASNDLSSNDNKGELPEFTVGTYSADFENAAFSLKKTGEISKPFQTSFGFHILKLLEAKPADADINNAAVLAGFEEKVTKDNRLDKSKKELIEKKLALIRYKPFKYNKKSLFTFTDSVILKTHSTAVKGINENTVLFSFAKQNIKAGNWIDFVKTARNSPDAGSRDNYSEFLKKFIQSAADEYYRKNLGDYNPGFARQVNEFKEANLLFGIMEKNVWSRANTDTAGLIQYYNLHKSKYVWQPSADAIIITCNNFNQVKELQQKLKDSVSSWRKIITNYGGSVVADSSRFEFGQLPVADRTNFTSNLLTAPVKNTNEGTYTFNYIIKVYHEPALRTFDDARGIVMIDYQQLLEDKWMQELKKKYPVKVNEAVFSAIK